MVAVTCLQPYDYYYCCCFVLAVIATSPACWWRHLTAYTRVEMSTRDELTSAVQTSRMTSQAFTTAIASDRLSGVRVPSLPDPM